MKKIPFNKKDLVKRKPIWIAISNLYLDTELQDYQHKNIAKIINESPYSLAEVQAIDKYEVFPILKTNLISVAGAWSGFKEDWLVKSILEKLEKQNFYNDSMIKISYYFMGKITRESWEKIRAEFLRLQS
ncbi:DUF7079 family protein [Portibacter lacus]|nr:hypothetical protein [Portibacter lacus]